MPIMWNKYFRPDIITDQIKRNVKLTDGGKIEMNFFFNQILQTTLFSMLTFPNEISEIDARRMTVEAFNNTIRKNKITPNEIKIELNKLEKQYYNLPINRFVLVTSISISQLLSIPRFHQGNNQIIIETKLPKIFESQFKHMILKASSSLFSDLPNHYSSVRIHVSSRTKYSAADHALENINYFRGVMNWTLTKKASMRKTYGGKPLPVNKIVLGPLHTLHYINGKLAADDEWWYEPSYLGEIKSFNPSQDELNNILQLTTQTLSKLKTHKYGNEIKSAFIRYANALDERDWSSSFIKLWGVLEFLTKSNDSFNHSNTIKRVSSLLRDHEFHSQVLNSLRVFRNSYIHSDKGNDEIETYLYQLKGYVDKLFNFHIYNKFRFESVEKASELLDLPKDNDLLQYKLKLINFALKHRK